MDNIKQERIEFTDNTLIEGDGDYKSICSIMDRESIVGAAWMLRTDAYLYTEAGSSFMILHFYSNGDLHIVGYGPSIPDVYYNPDIQFISVWAQSKGWNTPSPSDSQVTDNLEFWKHFWETLLVDSEYLDKRYGKREILYTEEDFENSEEEL